MRRVLKELIKKPSISERKKQSRPMKPYVFQQWANDAVIVVVVSIIMTLVGGYFDVFEAWHDVVVNHENWELDEITIGVFSASIMLIWYAWRQKIQSDILKRMAIENEKRANLASEAKSTFLANMSHELRTPLNAILGFSESINLGIYGAPANDIHKEYVEEIFNSASHLHELINDILDISAVESNKIQLNDENLDVQAVCEDGLQQVRMRAEASNIRLGKDINHGLPLLRADKLRLMKILLNILSNAVKFTPSGGTVTLSASLDSDNAHVVTVTDTGIGMDENEVLNALKEYGQVESVYTKKHKGTGLGLPLSQRLAELHGGTLLIDSEKGVGTSITVKFPHERTITSKVTSSPLHLHNVQSGSETGTNI